MYHRVIDLDKVNYQELPGMFVTSKSFEIHTKYLKKFKHVLPLEELFTSMSRGENVQNCCSITFDDGWSDNFDCAFPIIKKYEIPVSIFLSTGFIDTDKILWPEEVCYFLSKSSIGFELQKYFSNNEINTLKLALRKRQGKRLDGEEMTRCIDKIKLLKFENRIILIEKIRKLNRKAGYNIEGFLNKKQISEMKASGFVDLYPHGHNHLFLSELKQKEIDFEISKSIEIVKYFAKEQKVHIFAYPSGRHNDRVKQILKTNEIRYGLSRTGGPVIGDINKNPFSVPRIPIHDDISYSEMMFRYYLSQQ